MTEITKFPIWEDTRGLTKDTLWDQIDHEELTDVSAPVADELLRVSVTLTDEMLGQIESALRSYRMLGGRAVKA